MRQFPAVWVGVIEAAIALLVAFGVDVTPDQTAGILGFAAAAGSAVLALTMWAPASHEREVDEVRVESFQEGWNSARSPSPFGPVTKQADLQSREGEQP